MKNWCKILLENGNEERFVPHKGAKEDITIDMKEIVWRYRKDSAGSGEEAVMGFCEGTYNETSGW